MVSRAPKTWILGQSLLLLPPLEPLLPPLLTTVAVGDETDFVEDGLEEDFGALGLLLPLPDEEPEVVPTVILDEPELPYPSVETIWPPAPRLLPHLPPDVFYPFRISAAPSSPLPYRPITVLATGYLIIAIGRQIFLWSES